MVRVASKPSAPACAQQQSYRCLKTIPQVRVVSTPSAPACAQQQSCSYILYLPTDYVWPVQCPVPHAHRPHCACPVPTVYTCPAHWLRLACPMPRADRLYLLCSLAISALPTDYIWPCPVLTPFVKLWKLCVPSYTPRMRSSRRRCKAVNSYRLPDTSAAMRRETSSRKCECLAQSPPVCLSSTAAEGPCAVGAGVGAGAAGAAPLPSPSAAADAAAAACVSVAELAAAAGWSRALAVPECRCAFDWAGRSPAAQSGGAQSARGVSRGSAAMSARQRPTCKEG